MPCLRLCVPSSALCYIPLYGGWIIPWEIWKLYVICIALPTVHECYINIVPRYTFQRYRNKTRCFFFRFSNDISSKKLSAKRNNRNESVMNHRILRSYGKNSCWSLVDRVSFLPTRYLVDITLSVEMGTQQRTSILTLYVSSSSR